MKRKPKRTTLRNKADRLFSLKVRERGYCQAAGLDRLKCSGNLQCCHIEGRKNHRLRWDEMNALCMCQGHHIHYTHNPWGWQEFIREHFPQNYAHVSSLRNEMWDKSYEKVLEGLF